jgi:hypothetical protein
MFANSHQPSKKEMNFISGSKITLPKIVLHAKHFIPLQQKGFLLKYPQNLAAISRIKM